MCDFVMKRALYASPARIRRFSISSVADLLTFQFIPQLPDLPFHHKTFPVILPQNNSLLSLTLITFIFLNGKYSSNGHLCTWLPVLVYYTFPQTTCFVYHASQHTYSRLINASKPDITSKVHHISFHLCPCPWLVVGHSIYPA